MFPVRAHGWTLNQDSVRASIHQLRATGSLPIQVTQSPNAPLTNSAFTGIPKPVSNVATYVNPGTGATQKSVTVTFAGNPEDKGFSHCKIWFKNYHGSVNPVLIASSPVGPVTFPADATGEHVTVIFQSVGSKGEVPLSVCRSSTVQL